MGCFFCQSNKDMLIKRGKYWTVLVNSNQCYLGMCMVKLNRHLVDLFDIKKEEREELFEVMKQLRNALKQLFKPDLFNYSSLGNEVRHLHIHFIPRYEEKRTFQGIEFVDERWGHHYKPYNKEFKIPQDVLDELKNLIKQKL